MTLITGVSAMKTDLARELEARGEAEGVLLGDWSFQVGTSGFDPGSPDVVTDVDPTLQALVAPLGGSRGLGRLVTSGAAAAVAAGSGPETMLVTGLAAIPDSAAMKWLRVTGSGDVRVNGTWLIRTWISATSVEVANPLFVAGDAGPLGWEFREAVAGHPNSKAASFFCRLLAPDGTVDGHELGEVGVFGRVLRAPTAPSLVGSIVLFAVAHTVGVVKVPQMVLNRHVVAQH